MARIEHARLLEVLHYSPETGVWTWVVSPKFTTIKIGDRAGSQRKSDGYCKLDVDGTRYEAGPLIWFYMTGVWPTSKIDHKDKDPDNNRWVNIREATDGQNQMNRGLQINNTSGYKGVCWNKLRGLWMAYIGGASCGRRKTIGYYATPQEANEARTRMAIAIYGREFAQ